MMKKLMTGAETCAVKAGGMSNHVGRTSNEGKDCVDADVPEATFLLVNQCCYRYFSMVQLD